MSQRKPAIADADVALESHFAFGENWADFAQIIDEDRLQAATEGLSSLLAGRELRGKRFLDIGCGSGLHSLAALRLGAAEVLAVDLDPRCIDTTRALLTRHAPRSAWRVEAVSVFDLEPERYGKFDFVYSWGVLHHTGNMAAAVRAASAMVSDGGSFVLALYRRTWLCPFWKMEKRWYSRASARTQKLTQSIYTGLFTIALWLRGRTYRAYTAECVRKARGMDTRHDTHDWLGGYPYESISSTEVDSMMRELGLSHVKSVVHHGLAARTGIFGSGCDEYHYRR